MKKLISLFLMLVCTCMAWGQLSVPAIETTDFALTKDDDAKDVIFGLINKDDATELTIGATSTDDNGNTYTISGVKSLGTNSTIKKIEFSSKIKSIYIIFNF